MLTIKNNSRQIPDSKTICADKKYYDILYGWLQQVSEFDDGIRFVDAKKVNFSQLAKIFGLSRQTVSTKMKNLEKMGLVTKNETKKRYELLILDPNVAALIPYDTLKLLVDTLSENSISSYVYLLSRYIANGEKPYQFTLMQVKSYIGISTATKSNDEIITNILFVLQKIGLIKYSMTTEQGSEFGNVKTIYQIDWMTNDVKNLDSDMKC